MKYISVEQFKELFGTSEIKSTIFIRSNENVSVYEIIGVDYLIEKDENNIFDLENYKELSDLYIDSPIRFTFILNYPIIESSKIVYVGNIQDNKFDELKINCHEILIEWDKDNFNYLNNEEFLDKYHQFKNENS